MGLLRSEAMRHGVLVLPVQEARKYIDKIGRETQMQFEDMNAREMRRPYRKHVQRIDEMERILRFMFEEIGKIEGAAVVKNKVDEFLAASENYKLDDVEAELAGLYQRFSKFKENNTKLMDDKNATVEELQVMNQAAAMLKDQDDFITGTGGLEEPLMEEAADRRLGYLAGVVLKSDQARFDRALWRATRGNILRDYTPIPSPITDPKTGQVVQKSVFWIYYQGNLGNMQQKIVKVCQAFGVNMYDWPSSAMMAARKQAMLRDSLSEKETALQAYQSYMRSETGYLLAPPAEGSNSLIEDWRLFCIKEKSIYTILNMCSGEIALRVNVWYPETDEPKILALLKEASAQSLQGAFLTPDKDFPKSTPPTYIKTNDFTQPWQEVVDTYGIAKYQEANPALLTMVTFPFVFGMMYGDVGHGTLLLCAGAFLCYKADDFKFTQPALYAYRYLVVMLGFFAVYAGFMYNDLFCIGMPLFKSGFDPPKGAEDSGIGQWTPNYDVMNTGGPGPYAFGIDWAWAGATNELLYLNSLKMKLSVLFGVLQMTVGVLLRWSNALYEKNLTDFFFECIPMMVFMLCFFGWMDVMILYKWVHHIDAAPSIINSLICMAMGQKDDFPFWDGSVELAQKLMKYTVFAVPFMLFPKPFILRYQHEAKMKNGGHELLRDEEDGGHGGEHGEHGEEFEFGEVFIHQIIETIEYVLGTVSHTASYLRIWALSLAHQQLSLVFFQKTLSMGLAMSFPGNAIMIYIMFTAWFGVTLGVLLGMDVLECFLHTLRLHWVEFQSKFYKNEGEKFAPFNIRQLVEPTGDD